jgi:hypothetical protein
VTAIPNPRTITGGKDVVQITASDRRHGEQNEAQDHNKRTVQMWTLDLTSSKRLVVPARNPYAYDAMKHRLQSQGYKQ